MMELPNISLQSNTATSRRWQLLQKQVYESKSPNQTVRIVASTRGLMADPVLEACEAGVGEFCEDYIPEGVTKKPVITHRFPSTTWHFGGIIQPNRLPIAVEYFEWIDMFDRMTLLQPLQEAFRKHPTVKTKILIEVNPIGSIKKNGARLEDVPYLCEELQKIPQVILRGLSCKSELMMNKPVAMKAYEKTFQIHKELLEKGILPSTATDLAIGSSRDYVEAIKLGSTMIRVGSAMFGQSAPSKSLLPFDEY